jgi:glycosyltransferase involved in cell wall biosynthesis
VTVGFYSPLPPARTGVADYAAALLSELRRHGQVEVAPANCDIALYQTGNNGLHAAIYRRALEAPGVVVLHDAVLHHFLLGQLDERTYVEEFVYNYGEWSRGLGQALWAGRASSGTDRRYFDHAMLRRIAERARAVVVHNPAAAAVVTKHAPGARVVEIPHLFAAPGLPGAAEAIRYRQQLGVEPEVTLFGVFGYLRESKRLVAAIDAFTEVHRRYPKTALLIAGEFVSTDLARAVEPMLGGEGMVRRPHLSEREFWMAARAVDVCLNLRYPAAGETSGIAVRFMGIGKPVMVTEGLESAGFPEDTCLRISTGVAERDSLVQHMLLLAAMPEVGAAMGERAAEFIRRHHRLEKVGAMYWELLRDASKAP